MISVCTWCRMHRASMSLVPGDSPSQIMMASVMISAICSLRSIPARRLSTPLGRQFACQLRPVIYACRCLTADHRCAWPPCCDSGDHRFDKLLNLLFSTLPEFDPATSDRNGAYHWQRQFYETSLTISRPRVVNSRPRPVRRSRPILCKCGSTLSTSVHISCCMFAAIAPAPAGPPP
jgi:hypothetical protein